MSPSSAPVGNERWSFDEATGREPTSVATTSHRRSEDSDVVAWLRMLLATPRLLPWATASPALRVRHWAKRRRDELAVAYEDRHLTWGELDVEADRHARWLLDEGLGRGDVVAVMLDNQPAFLTIFTALSRIGAVAALINTQLKAGGLTHAFEVSGPRRIVCGAEYVDAVLDATRALAGFVPEVQIVVQRDTAHTDPPGLRVLEDALPSPTDLKPVADVRLRNTDRCCFVYTSGTTGLPKAAVIRNQRMLGGGTVFGHLMHRSRPDDLIYVALPLFHSSALFLGWGAALATGAGIALRRRFSVSRFWDDVNRWRATSFLYIGEMCRYLLDAPARHDDGAHCLRTAVGNGMRPDLWRAFQLRFRVPVVREFYGATEGNAPLLNIQGRVGKIGRMARGQAVVRCDPTTGEPERGADGFCLRVAPGETGLLLGRISRVLAFDGYLDSRATEQKVLVDVFRRGDRYFDSGDLVTLDRDGWLSFADRIGDTFRWKGENVSTLEVAAAIGRAHGVRDVAVFGVEIPGCEGRACMAALGVDDRVDLVRLAEHFETELAPYQRPLLLRLLSESLRTTSTFKQLTASYRREGFDPARVSDPIYVSRSGRFERCDQQVYESIAAGRFVPS